MAFSAQPPDLHRLSLGRESFAVLGPLALLDSASYPVSVRRLADSLAPSFSPPLAVGTLGFTWIATTSSPGDSHPQVTCHAGHTEKTATSERWGWPLRESPGELLAHRGHRNVAGFLGRPASDQARVGSLA